MAAPLPLIGSIEASLLGKFEDYFPGPIFGLIQPGPWRRPLFSLRWEGSRPLHHYANEMPVHANRASSTTLFLVRGYRNSGNLEVLQSCLI